jgi:hypothetical protein
MSEWQPIETAPKDGTRVIVYPILVPSLFRRTGRSDASYMRPLEPAIAYWYGPESNGYWVGVHHRDAKTNPTHWMPLPEPPK